MGSMLDKGERIMCVPFSLHSPLLTVQRSLHLPASQLHLDPALLAARTPSLPVVDLFPTAPSLA